MEGIARTKDAIRRQMRMRRKELSPEERTCAAKIVCAKLCDSIGIHGFLEPESNNGAIAVYLAAPDEIDLSGFIHEMLACGVKVVAPRWNGETYELATVKSLSESDLRRGPKDILEPAEAEIAEPSDVGAWIVPGLAFTRDGRRLGYGGGWYDRLLASACKGALRIGVAHEFQIVDDLPQEPHDIHLDRIVTANLPESHFSSSLPL